jgi:hypothetical protein
MIYRKEICAAQLFAVAEPQTMWFAMEVTRMERSKCKGEIKRCI